MTSLDAFLESRLSRGRASFTREELLLELAGHEPQAKALDRFAQEAKPVKLLDFTSKAAPGELSARRKIAVNTPAKPGSRGRQICKLSSSALA